MAMALEKRETEAHAEQTEFTMFRKVWRLLRGKEKISLAQKVSLMRASVMGANDGIISVAGIVLGVAGATTNNFAIFISGIGGMLAGTISMAMGEFVSVHSQKDAQERAVAREQQQLAVDGRKQQQFIADKLQHSGISRQLAERASEEMMAKDPLTAIVREKYGFHLNDLTSPFLAAMSSMVSFTAGSVLPLVAITLLPETWKIVGTGIAVFIALFVTGYSAAVLGNANRVRGVARNVVAGLLTMTVTYLVGSLFA
ncbi:MAG: VIT family protein [Sporolactobacillus sp.]